MLRRLKSKILPIACVITPLASVSHHFKEKRLMLSFHFVNNLMLNRGDLQTVTGEMQ